MSTLLQDLRYALRILRRSPGFTVVAVLCLGLGVGVNTAMFSIVNTFLLRPLPLQDPDRILMLYGEQPKQGIDESGMSVVDLQDIRAHAPSLQDVAGITQGGFNLAGGDEPVRLQGARVTHNLFPLIGVQPMLGRNFLPEEDAPGGERVVILGHDLWERQFGADPEVLGRAVTIGGKPATVVGVMPPRFKFPETEELWVPMRPDLSEPRSERWIWTVARLRPDATLDQARAEVADVARRIAAESPTTNAGWTFGAKRWKDEFVEGDLPLMLGLMLGAVGFVLLIACANVANLLLARATARQREIAIRLAIGAGRGRVIRQLLTESVLVALAGGVLGTLIAVWWIDWTVARIPEELAYWITFDVDQRVLLYTFALSVATGLVFGILPALRASRPDLTRSLKEGARGAAGGLRRNRLRSALVTGEIALSLVLLVGAALMIRSFLAAVNADLGFDTGRMLTMRTSLTGERYDRVATRAAFFEQMQKRIEALPGARVAALTTALPADEGGVSTVIVAEGQPRAPGEETSARYIGITPGYWEMLGRPLLAGRDFTPQEAADSNSTVVILNRDLAEQLWPGQDALGKRVQIAAGERTPWLTVVGIAPTLHYEGIGNASAQARRQVHVPYARAGWRLMTLMVRTEGPPGNLAPAVRTALRSMDATLPVFSVRSMDEYRAYTTWDRRLFGEAFGSFGMFALLLAAVGVYGVMAYAVSQRAHEIGIRMALGAQSADVLRLVVGEGAVMVAAGVGVGLLGALGVSRVMRSVLYGVSPNDPIAFLGIPVLLGGVALLASYLPARRAMRADPMVALRAE